MGWITRARDERQQAAAGGRELAARSEAYREPDVPVRVGAQAPQSELDAEIDRLAELYPETTDPGQQADYEEPEWDTLDSQAWFDQEEREEPVWEPYPETPPERWPTREERWQYNRDRATGVQAEGEAGQ